MSDYEVQGMLIQLEATTAQLRRELAGADSVVARTTQNIDRNLAQVDSAFDRTARGAQQAGTLIRGAFAAIAGAGLVGSIIHQVDAYGQIADRLKMATGSTEEYNEVQQHLLRTAQETYRPLAEAQELYIRTADVMRSLGFDTQQTLDITDSFSFLLVTNAASADKASSALGAYSKALQTGKVEADGWVSIQDAMPTIVDAIASATGKSAEEIRKLGVQGKLSLDDINTGLLRTVEVNRKAAADMSVSVQDALVNIQNSITTFAAGIEEGTGALDLLASALGVVANNVEWLAGLVGGALVGALTLYSRAQQLPLPPRSSPQLERSLSGMRVLLRQTPFFRQPLLSSGKPRRRPCWRSARRLPPAVLPSRPKCRSSSLRRGSGRQLQRHPWPRLRLACALPPLACWPCWAARWGWPCLPALRRHRSCCCATTPTRRASA